MKDKIIEFDSMRAAAAWTGYPLAVLKLAKQSGCDAFASTRVDLQKLIRWISSAQKKAIELPEGIPSWAEMHNKWKSEREKLRLEKDKGTVMDLELVRRYAGDAENYYCSELDRLERESPAMLKGMTPEQIRDSLGKFMKDLRQRSREYFAKAGGAE